MTTSIRAALLTYLDRHVGQIVSLGDLVAATGLTPTQIQSNLSNIRNARTDTGFDMAASLSVVTAGQQRLRDGVAVSRSTAPVGPASVDAGKGAKSEAVVMKGAKS